MTTVPKRSTLSIIFRILAFLLLLGAGLYLLIISDFDPEQLLEMVRGTTPLTFIILMSLLPLLGFPIAAFYLFGGTAFPWWQAALCCSIALGINIALAYPIAKYLLHDPISDILSRYRRAIPTFSTKNQFRMTFLIRSLPGIPYFMQNYFLPLLGVRFVHYWTISWVVQSVIAAGMVAVPKLVEKTGWVTGGIIVGIVATLLIILKILHRIYMPSKGSPQTDPSEPMA